MPYFYYGFDWTYLTIMIPCLILSLIASVSVKSTFQKYEKQLSSRHVTGAQAAKQVLLENGITDVQIERVRGDLTDHYDPQKKVIRLSDSVYDSTSTAAIGVACHEAGHAAQYASNYFPVRIRSAIIPVTNIGSRLAMPLILLGVLFGAAGNYAQVFIDIGILCFSLSFIFQLITLPVEFNASRRAVQTISENGILTDEEQIGARKTLRAAAMTYVAATFVALAQLLRLVLLFGNRRRD